MATTLFSNKSWHWHPTMYLSCSYTATRSSPTSNKVSYTFNFSNKMGTQAYYGSSNALGIKITVDDVSTIGYIVGDDYNDTSGEISFDRTNTNASGSSSVTIDIWCHQGTYANPTR